MCYRFPNHVLVQLIGQAPGVMTCATRYVAGLSILINLWRPVGWALVDHPCSSLCSSGPMVGGSPCLLGHKVCVWCNRLIMGPSRSSTLYHAVVASIGVQHAAWWWEANDICSGAPLISLYVLTGIWSALCCGSLWLASGVMLWWLWSLPPDHCHPLSRLGYLDEVAYHAPLTWVGSSVGFIPWMELKLTVCSVLVDILMNW